MQRISDISSQGWMVRHYWRGHGRGEDNPARRNRDLAIRRMVGAIRAAIEAEEDPEAILTAIVDSLVPKEIPPRF